ncbi:SixA phosphatase family protein [Hirschia litorea]|uniref:SixA phosphatase family protein n=1 Tax=Hirschia litorea TaxID=1199156 RepID=A0ABW2IKB6_9PROT
MKKFLFGIAIALFLNACATNTPADNITTVYLVRHAEKENDGTKDPSLSQQGQVRATYLAQLLNDVKLDAIYSTPYRRTTETAAPVLTQSGLDSLTSYAGNDLEDVAQKIHAKQGTYLIVGHSNTTPQLVSILIQRDVAPLEESDFDRLYKVTLHSDGDTHLEMLPYTPPS